jgi:hypothetical protein
MLPYLIRHQACSGKASLGCTRQRISKNCPTPALAHPHILPPAPEWHFTSPASLSLAAASHLATAMPAAVQPAATLCHLSPSCLPQLCPQLPSLLLLLRQLLHKSMDAAIMPPTNAQLQPAPSLLHVMAATKGCKPSRRPALLGSARRPPLDLEYEPGDPLHAAAVHTSHATLYAPRDAPHCVRCSRANSHPAAW